MRKPKKPNQYKIANEEFLQTKAATGEYLVLESGILLKRLEEGHGRRRPALSDVIFCNYTGRLIDGTVFDTTEGMDLPPVFRLRELIVGWQAALLRMVEGDRYEVIIPAKYGYGSFSQPDIPAYSTLLFEIELLKIN